jgi:hypothetical protein
MHPSASFRNRRGGMSSREGEGVAQQQQKTNRKNERLHGHYMMSIALTKAVVWKGRMSVNHSQWVKMANANAAVEAKKTNHQIPRAFLDCSMNDCFGKNRTSEHNYRCSTPPFEVISIVKNPIFVLCVQCTH